jgi:hypothetical protein
MALEMPPNVFERRFRDLTPTDVRTFLESVSGEGMLWEGKGTAELSELRRHIREEVCGLANQLGGYLIVGAVRKDGVWSLPGVSRGALKEEPHDWIARVITGGLVNAPPFDIRCWELEPGKLAAVIEVEPVPAPPTMTSGGVVWQRLVGETRKVTDAGVLAELIRRGEEARSRAEALALRAVNRAMVDDYVPAENLLTVGLAPVASQADVSSRLFVPRFRQELIEAASGLPTPPTMHQNYRQPIVEQSRDRWIARVGDIFDSLEPMQWAVWASWDATIAVQYGLPAGGLAARWDVDEIVRMAWAAGARLLPEITGIRHDPSAPVHFALEISEPAGELHLKGHPVTTGARRLQRWATMQPPSEGEISSIERELLRSVPGSQIYEPEDT